MKSSTRGVGTFRRDEQGFNFPASQIADKDFAEAAHENEDHSTAIILGAWSGCKTPDNRTKL